MLQLLLQQYAVVPKLQHFICINAHGCCMARIACMREDLGHLHHCSESEEAAASSANMLATPIMASHGY